MPTPFHLIPLMRGPLADGDFVQPLANNKSVFFRYSPKEHAWSWSPDASRAQWFACTSLDIPTDSEFATFVVEPEAREIIDYLNRTRAEPPLFDEPADLDQLLQEQERKSHARAVPPSPPVSIQPTNEIADVSAATLTLDATRVRANEALVFRGCRDSAFTVTAVHTKLVIEQCVNCQFVVEGKNVSAVADIYKSSQIVLTTRVAIKTLQIDNAAHLKLFFGRIDYFHSVVWTASTDIDLHIAYGEDDDLKLLMGTDVIREKHPEVRIDEEKDQFITRIIDGALLTEKVIRLANGFPSTQREKDAWDARQARNMHAFMSSAGNTIVSRLLLNGRTKFRDASGGKTATNVIVK